MKTIAVISLSDLATDPRANRQIRFLLGHYRLVTIGAGSSHVPGVDFIPVPALRPPFRTKMLMRSYLLTGQYDRHYWVQPIASWVKETLSRVGADLVLVNDLVCLPAALEARTGKVIFDAHEYAPGEQCSIRFRLWHRRRHQHLCNTCLPQAAAVMTVCQSIADLFERDCGVKPLVITNAPDFEELEPRPVSAGKIRMVHHGGAMRIRRLEGMIRLAGMLDSRFELDFLLTSDPAYIRRLQRLASRQENIRFLQPVPMRELPRFLNSYDIGIFLLPPTCVSYRYALPNKFFEFIQARLGVAIGPSPEMARVVREHDLGVVADDFRPESLAALLNQLDSERVNYFKRRAHEAARLLSAEPNRRKLLELVESVIGS